MILLKLVLIPMLLKVLEKSGRPFVCSTLYALVLLTNGLIFDLAFGASVASVFLAFVAAYAASSLYFYLLHHLDGSGMPYWAVLSLGAVGLMMM